MSLGPVYLPSTLLLIPSVFSCCTGDFAALWERPPTSSHPLESLGLRVWIAESSIAGTYSATPGPAPDFDGDPCPDAANCFGVVDSFFRRGRAIVGPVGGTDQVAIAFSLSYANGHPHRAFDVWGGAYLLDPGPHVGSRPVARRRFAFPPGCLPWSSPSAPPSGATDDGCEAAALRDADTDLNRVYRALRSDLPRGAFLRLRDAQRSWLRQRDSTCSAARAGSVAWAAPTVETLCLYDETVRRTAWLRR